MTVQGDQHHPRGTANIDAAVYLIENYEEILNQYAQQVLEFQKDPWKVMGNNISSFFQGIGDEFADRSQAFNIGNANTQARLLGKVVGELAFTAASAAVGGVAGIAAKAAGKAAMTGIRSLKKQLYELFGKNKGSLAAGSEATRYAQYWENLAKMPGTLSDRTARAWYLSQEAKIPSLLNPAASLEQQAMQASALRNTFRTQARELMADREYAAFLNRTEPNMTWQQVVDKYTGQGFSGDALWNRIIQGSQASRPSVNTGLGF